MSEVPLYRSYSTSHRTRTPQHFNQPCLVRQARFSFIPTPHHKGNVSEMGLFSVHAFEASGPCLSLAGRHVRPSHNPGRFGVRACKIFHIPPSSVCRCVTVG